MANISEKGLKELKIIRDKLDKNTREHNNWVGSGEGEYSHYEAGDVICGKCNEPMIAGFFGLNHNLPHEIFCLKCNTTLIIKAFGKHKQTENNGK